MTDELTLFTIGHSTRKLKEFIHILKKYSIQRIIDVRRFPTSKKFPHFKKERLEKSLPRNNIEYVWLGEELGGYRNQNYTEYMQTESFMQGVQKVIEIGKGKPSAIMCAERFYWRCHRRFIASKLKQLGVKIIHIIDASYDSTPDLPFERKG